MKWAAAAILLLCSCAPAELPPFAEAVVSVDVQVPGPRVVSRLRVDVFDAAGNWLDSRDIARPDPADWPSSFSVYSEDESKPSQLWLRLRAYPEGAVRDYRGERFWNYLDSYDQPKATTNLPRLIRNGVDITPNTEPLPLVTIDRLVKLTLHPGQVSDVPLLLHAACAGNMAKLSVSGIQLVDGEAQSCIDNEKQRSVVVVQAPGGDPLPPGSLAGPSQQQRYSIDCEVSDKQRVCVPGAATIFGSAELTLFPELPSVPERTVVIAPFVVDREEVTVGRFREALANGFTPSQMPIANNNPLGTTVASTCSYSDSDIGRERYALSCIAWQSAREVCQYWGGDLPREAQWERIATLTSNGRSRYPWGDQPPSCDHAIHGRMTLGGTAGVCEHLGRQPLPVDAAPLDVSPLGVIGLAGGVAEWMLDSYAEYADSCWIGASLFDPQCEQDPLALRSTRGGNWLAPPTILSSALRLGVNPTGRVSFIGFRCVYPLEASR